MNMLTYITFPNRTKAAEKLAAHVVRNGIDKKARSSSWGRLWVSLSMKPGYVCVGFHGQGQPLVVLRRGEL